MRSLSPQCLFPLFRTKMNYSMSWFQLNWTEKSRRPGVFNWKYIKIEFVVQQKTMFTNLFVYIATAALQWGNCQAFFFCLFWATGDASFCWPFDLKVRNPGEGILHHCPDVVIMWRKHMRNGFSGRCLSDPLTSLTCFGREKNNIQMSSKVMHLLNNQY